MGTRHPALDQAQLYGIVDLAYVRAVDSLDVADNILSGGVQVLQLRAKNQAPETIPPLARELSAPAVLPGWARFIAHGHSS